MGKRCFFGVRINFSKNLLKNLFLMVTSPEKQRCISYIIKSQSVIISWIFNSYVKGYGYFFWVVISKWFQTRPNNDLYFIFLFFREKNIVWTKDYQSTKIWIACYTEKGRMLKDISLVNVHWLFQNEPVFPELAVLWAAATFRSPQVNHLHCMWFSRNHKLYKENCFNSLKKSKNVTESTKFIFKEIISLIKVSMNLDWSIRYVYFIGPKITLKHWIFILDVVGPITNQGCADKLNTALYNHIHIGLNLYEVLCSVALKPLLHS